MIDETEYFTEDATDRRAALDAGVRSADHDPGEVLRHASRFYDWLRKRPSIVPVTIVVGAPVITDQDGGGGPPVTIGAGMPTELTDSQIATYPPAMALDAKGFQVPSDAITASEDSGGALATLTMADGSDPAVPAGSAVLSAVAPGDVTVTWTDGTVSFADVATITTGAVASIEVGAAVITDQAPPEPPPAP